MGTIRNPRGLLSVFLAAALVFSVFTVPVSADETGEETTATQATQPEQTHPEETTLPEEQQETQPAQTQPEQITVSSISFVKTQPTGTRGITVQGTVVYAGYGLTVLQDRTGGICLEFEQETQVSPGLILQVTGSKTDGGLLAQDCRIKGSTDLPEEEATLDSAEDCVRVVIRDVTFRTGELVQGATAMPMSPSRPEGVATRDVVTVWGVISEGWFYADKVTAEQKESETIPAVTATPHDRILVLGENIGLHCAAEDVQIYYATSPDGETYTAYARYSGGIPVEPGMECLYIRAYALGEDGQQGEKTEFCFRSEATEEDTQHYHLYFGQLHAHTDFSDGLGTVEEAFAYASEVPGLDFFAVTDHSNSFDNNTLGDIRRDGSAVSEEWAAGKQAAAEATGEDFVAIFGYEMTWGDRNQLGHINTFNTPGWQSRNQEEFSTLESYYQALTTVPGSVSQFNHPGVASGYFRNFAYYSPQYDAVIQLLEVGSEAGYRAYDYYTKALDAGWHVAPTNNQANHEGYWGDASDVRTVVLAQSLTEQSLYEAMAQRRVYATEDKDLQIVYRVNGQIMGSILKEQAHTITVELKDPTDSALGTLEVVTEKEETLLSRRIDSNQETLTISVPEARSYYYIRITQPDGDVAVTAPVWVDMTVDAGIEAFSADDPEPAQGQEVALTLALYNNEREDFLLEQIVITMDGLVIHRDTNPGRVDSLGTLRRSFPLRYDGLGTVKLLAQIQGTVDSTPVSDEEEISLHYRTQETQTSLSAISHVRRGETDEVYTIRGNVTAGTANRYNSFPETLYLQDNTGGIAVVDFFDTGIGLGTALEVTGQLTFRNGNPVLRMIDYAPSGEADQNPLPKAMNHAQAMIYDTYGGQLLQVEGKVVTLTRTEDEKGISRMVLKDLYGDLAVVRIDDYIGRSTDGVNNLYSKIRIGDTVSAIGILHREADGTAVLRVRNCEEVVTVEAPADLSNPKTGDTIRIPTAVMVLSLLLLAGIPVSRRKRR